MHYDEITLRLISVFHAVPSGSTANVILSNPHLSLRDLIAGEGETLSALTFDTAT